MITAKDRAILRELAKKQFDIANSPGNLRVVAEWRRHADRKPGMPMVHVEIDTFEHEIIEPLLRCEDAAARQMEHRLYHAFINRELFGDDKPVPPYFPVENQAHFRLFGSDISVTRLDGSIGHRFNHIIGDDLQQDYGKLGPSEYGIDRAASEAQRARVEDAFGDILPVKACMNALYAVPTQKIVHMMGMESMYMAMMDCPELFMQMMDRIADDYIGFFRFLQREKALLPTTGFEKLGNGTFCFTSELAEAGDLATTDVWGFLDSQETVCISPEMFAEFIFPCYQKIAAQYGLLSYGCCEPVHPVWACIGTLPNLRKISISPWCDESFMGERLRGSNVIYHRKPSPNFLGVGKTLDEAALQEHILATLRAAQGCTLEITQRDVYTVHGNAGKVRRFVAIIRECAQREWRP